MLTMYEKGSGKVARHAWTGECHNIGLISYLTSAIYKQAWKALFVLEPGSQAASICLAPGQSS